MSNERIAELYDYAYEGEVVGVHLFDEMAAHEWGSSHREALTLAKAVEEQTRAMLRPLLEARGVALADDDACRISASNYAAGFFAGEWHDFCKDLVDWSGDAMAKFEELRDLVPDSERNKASQLIDHEAALIAFAEVSATGDEATATATLRDHLHQHSAELS